MKKWDVRRVSGYGAIILSAAYSTAALLAPLFVGKANADFLFSIPILVSYWGGVAALFSTYIVESFEKEEKALNRLEIKEFNGLETFHDADSFVNKLADVSVDASTIATLNFSPPAGASVALDRYFKRIHAYISTSDTNLVSFRSIASIEGKAKANWILKRSAMFHKNPRVSLSCFKEKANIRLMCYHIVIKNGIGYCFFYPPVPLTGVMSAFLIVNKQLADLMLAQFDLAWAKTITIVVGGSPVAEGLKFLSQQGADSKSEEFLRMSDSAIQNHY